MKKFSFTHDKLPVKAYSAVGSNQHSLNMFEELGSLFKFSPRSGALGGAFLALACSSCSLTNAARSEIRENRYLAEVGLPSLASLSPDQVLEAYARLANSYRSLGEVENERFYKNKFALALSDASIRVEGLAKQGKFDLARAEITRSIHAIEFVRSRDPQRAQALTRSFLLPLQIYANELGGRVVSAVNTNDWSAALSNIEMCITVIKLNPLSTPEEIAGSVGTQAALLLRGNQLIQAREKYLEARTLFLALHPTSIEHAEEITPFFEAALSGLVRTQVAIVERLNSDDSEESTEHYHVHASDEVIPSFNLTIEYLRYCEFLGYAGRKEEARATLREAYQQLSAGLIQERFRSQTIYAHEDLRRASSALYNDLCKNGPLDEAVVFEQTLLQAIRTSWGKNSPLVGAYLLDLAKVECRSGDKDLAEIRLREALEYLKQNPYFSPSDLKETLNLLAEIYREQGDDQSAEAYAREALEIALR
jgi:tetratricopeptide (TPR) repeat protein